MKLTAILVVLAAVLVSATATATAREAESGAASGVAPLREFEGTVVSVNRDARRFRLRDSERGTVRIKVTDRTRFERLAGLSSLQRRAERDRGQGTALERASGWRSRSSARAAAETTAGTTTAARTRRLRYDFEARRPGRPRTEVGRSSRPRS